jgi:hypothetical protein
MAKNFLILKQNIPRIKSIKFGMQRNQVWCIIKQITDDDFNHGQQEYIKVIPQ